MTVEIHRGRKLRSLTLAALALAGLGLPPQARAAADHQDDLASAIAADMRGLDAARAVQLRDLFGLANGTRRTFVGGKLRDLDNLAFATCRASALGIPSVPDADAKSALDAYLHACATTKGGRAYLADLVPSVEMNGPGLVTRTAHQLWLRRSEYAWTLSDGKTLAQVQAIDLGSAARSVAPLEALAARDPIKPRALAGPRGGWNNDPYVYYDASDRLHVFFQFNPFAASWNHMHWGHLVESKGVISHRPIALEPRPEQGYPHNFSGSILANTIPDPADPSRQVNAAFFTATGTGEHGFVTFLQAPPTVMAVTSDPDLDTWRAERYTVTDQDTYRNRIDTIQGGTVANRYDMRDPIVFRRDGRYFMITAGTAVPGRVGQGVIAILEPSDPDDLSKPWVYLGDMFRHPQQTLGEGGPGIMETPNLQRIGDKDVLFFGAQRRSSEGNLRGFHFHQGLQYFVGTFDASTGRFTPDSTEPGYFEYGNSVYAMNSAAKPGVPGAATLEAWIHGFDGLPIWNDVVRGWNGAITPPLVMTLVDGRPHVVPDEQLAAKRGRAWYAKASFTVNPRWPAHTWICERTLDIRTQIALSPSATSGTLNVLTRYDGTGGIPIAFDGYKIVILKGTSAEEQIPLFATRTPVLGLEVVVDRSVVAVYANGKMLHKVVNPPMEDPATYAGGVSLQAAGGRVTFSKFSAYSLR